MTIQQGSTPHFLFSRGEDELGFFADIEVTGSGVTGTQRLRWVKPGMFLMGSPPGDLGRFSDECPRHQVTLTRGFWISDTACTQALWRAVTGSNPSFFVGDQLPVDRVSQRDALRFLELLSSGLPESPVLTLPTEAQWEYACRAGSETTFAFGDEIGRLANYQGKQTVPVKSFPPNAWGLHEMHGNVWEWCADGARQYTEEPASDPVGPSGSVLRGGSWYEDAGRVRSAYRGVSGPLERYVSIGFRFCCIPKAGT